MTGPERQWVETLFKGVLINYAKVVRVEWDDENQRDTRAMLWTRGVFGEDGIVLHFPSSWSPPPFPSGGNPS